MEDTRDRGHVHVPENGDPPKSWKMFLPENDMRQVDPHDLKKMLQGISSLGEQESELPHVMMDKINAEMYDNIRPLEWVDP